MWNRGDESKAYIKILYSNSNTHIMSDIKGYSSRLTFLFHNKEF